VAKGQLGKKKGAVQTCRDGQGQAARETGIYFKKVQAFVIPKALDIAGPDNTRTFGNYLGRGNHF
jgi:ABC-type arginine/histidine transport system permease subunit